MLKKLQDKTCLKLVAAPYSLFNMRDPFNPTPEEIRTWAYDPNSIDPMQDWELIVMLSTSIDDLIRYSADSGCPQKIFFAYCLRLRAEHATRAEGPEAVKNMYEKIKNTPSAGVRFLDLKKFLEKLLKIPYKFWQRAFLMDDPEKAEAIESKTEAKNEAYRKSRGL